jgi:hypothetical protein
LYSQTEMEGIMTYREKLLKAYEESLRAYGVNEVTLRSALMAFDTGFSAGALITEDDDVKEKMINNLTSEPNLN